MLRGATHYFNSLNLKSRASVRSATALEAQKRSAVGGEELEVAAITYLRVSGLEGLGSPIISGVGSV